ncbi:UNVERIFIED_CONTAM: hypothetical protein GTU68_025683, partial [Idotea baltica]|nr:hypothetical protein [Idotea baltica]
MSTNPLPMRGEDVQPHRFLYSLDQEGMKREMVGADDKVHFVSVNSNVSNGGRSLEVKEEKSTTVDESMKFRHNMAMKVLEKRILEQKKKEELLKKSKSKEAVEVEPRKDRTYAGSAAIAWSGGSFRYNPYGEPVYNHDNRPNYIPKERVVHLDLKGAPPLPSTYKTLIPWLAKYGATSILIEYEDMFPWEGTLKSFAAKNHYSKKDIEEIIALSKANNIQVIPLVQTFGHLEFALKLSKYSYLREVPELPQALCPSQNDSKLLVHTMIDQIMALHRGAEFLHIGCDEVFQMGECDKCRLKPRDNLFLEHVSQIAKYVRTTHGAIPLIWHDMLTHVSESYMKDYNIGELVEPVVWVYAEDVYRFIQPSTWTKFAQVFPTVWGASAFKGAFGEQSTVPNVRRHMDNNLNWLDVMASEGPKFTRGFRGIVLSGWQRHDHFAVLCELLPAAMPSLAVNLITNSHGFFNATIHFELYEALNCMQTPKYQTGLNLDSDPFLWDKFSWCYFPGAMAFK